VTDVPTIFDRALPLNLIANTVVFFVAARLYVLPLASRLRPQQILIPILLLHSTRHLGMMFLTRGATYPGSGSVRRSGDCDYRIYSNPARITRLSPCQARRLDIQHFRNGRSARGNHDRDDLQRGRRNGASVLDPRFLGSAVTGDSLRDFCSSPPSLAELTIGLLHY